MPQFVSFPVQGRDDWQRIRARLDPGDAPGRVGDIEGLRRACSDPDTPTLLPICGAYGQARNLLGEEGLAYSLYDDPLLIEEILENWVELYQELIRTVAAHVRVDSILVWEDMCFKSGPLMSPDHVRRLMLPRYRRLFDTFRSSGGAGVIVDTDGDCTSLLPLFVEAGVDCLMPFEVQAGMDVVTVAAEYPQLSIMGGIDKRALARSDDAVRAEVERVVPAFLERRLFIPTLDHTVPPDVPLRRFEYYLECLRGYE